MTVCCLKARVYPTIDRADAKGQFIVRMSSGDRDKLDVEPGNFVIVTKAPALRVPGAPEQVFEVLASVRDLTDDCGARPKDDGDYVRLDITLREAIGVKSADQSSSESDIIIMRRAPTGLWRSLCLKFSRILGYQFVVCRVQRAFTGDAETPLCRMNPATIESLGLVNRGVVVVLSCSGQVTMRVLPFDTQSDSSIRDVREAMTPEEILPRMDFDSYLGLDPANRGRFPDVHIDAETRESLKVAPGQAVWVRRSPGYMLLDKLGFIVVSLIVVTLTMILSDDTRENIFSLFGVSTLSVTALVLFVIAGAEVRKSAKRP